MLRARGKEEATKKGTNHRPGLMGRMKERSSRATTSQHHTSRRSPKWRKPKPAPRKLQELGCHLKDIAKEPGATFRTEQLAAGVRPVVRCMEIGADSTTCDLLKDQPLVLHLFGRKHTRTRSSRATTDPVHSAGFLHLDPVTIRGRADQPFSSDGLI